MGEAGLQKCKVSIQPSLSILVSPFIYLHPVLSNSADALMHLLVWGSNVTSPFPGDAILTCPTRIELEEGEEVIWVGWVNVILKRADGE